MFSGLWAKIVAGLSVVIGAMAILLKIRGHQVEKLKEANAGHEIKADIREDVEEAAKDIEDDKNEQLDKNDGSDHDKFI